MKKSLALITMFLLIGNMAKSQILISLLLGDKLNSDKLEFGLDGGASWSNIHGLNAKSLMALNLGFYFDIKFKNPSWMFNTGVMVKSSMGANDLAIYSTGNQYLDSVFINGNVTRRINYFNVPILIKYKFKNNLFIKAGTQLGLSYKPVDQFKNSISEEDDVNYNLSTKGLFHRIDAGLSLGLGYRLMKGNGMNIGVQYYYGLVNIMKDKSIPSQYNRAIYLTVGIPVGKHPQKAE